MEDGEFAVKNFDLKSVKEKKTSERNQTTYQINASVSSRAVSRMYDGGTGGAAGGRDMS